MSVRPESTLFAAPASTILSFRFHKTLFDCAVFLCWILILQGSLARGATIRGQVVDPVGAAIPGAKVILVRAQKAAGRTHTNAQGFYSFSPLMAGRYYVHVDAPGLRSQDSPSVFVSEGATVNLKVLLQIGPLRQQVVVSDSGTQLPESQAGASISLIDRQEMDALGKLNLADALRLMPGVEVVQAGQRGGVTSVFVRGGDYDFNKVLVDGVPANDLGGEFDFANESTSGIDSVEVLRGPNSALYGSDALASVINITTRQGTTPVPQLTYSADGGNFNTLHQEVSLGGVYRQFDYFSDFSRFDTQNGLPNSSFHNGTYSGNFGWDPGKSTHIRLTARHDATGLGLSNALYVYGIPDHSFQREQNTYLGITAQNQTTPHWHNVLRLTSTDIQYHSDDPSPAGIPFAPDGGNFLGDPVTICGANGYCAQGQAILDFAGAYPELYNSGTHVKSVYAQSDYSLNSDLGAIAGFEYDNETGFTESSGAPKSASVRNNYNGFLEAHGSLRRRLFATAGVGLDSNAIFGFATTPRVSAAYYLRQPAAGAPWGHTKLRFNFGTGIEEPSIFDQGASLHSLLSAIPQGAALIEQYRISPVGPDRSTTLDFGVEQGIWNERARVEISFFHDRFADLIDYVPQSALPQLGVPAAVAALAPEGATINSDSFRSMGAEAGIDLSLSQNWILKANYTYLDAVVTQSFASSALFPAINPAFPNIPIGAFAPLAGARPFRRPPHSGNALLGYSRRRYGLDLTGYFISRSDDSTYLTDANFGNTLLLPNRDLLMGYQLVNFSGWYNVRRGVELYTSLGNVLNERYMAAFGYPALPLTFRMGIKFTLGGEGWKW